MYTHYFAIFAALGLLQSVSCYPHFWIFPEHSGYGRTHTTPPSCFDHPTDQWGAHPGPQLDVATLYQMLFNGKPTTKICPGEAYKLKITFPQPRYAMVTAKGLTFKKTYLGVDRERDARDALCTGRLFLDSSINIAVQTKQLEYIVDATVDCSALALVELKSSSGALGEDFFHISTATVTVDKSCATAKCGGSSSAATTPTPTPATTKNPSPKLPAPKTPGGTETEAPETEAPETEAPGDHKGHGTPKAPSSTPTTTPRDTPSTTTTPSDTPSTTTTPSGAASTNTASSTSTTPSTAITPSSSTSQCKVPLKLASSCTKSPLGYQCSSDMSDRITGMKVHWQVGGCPPQNPCTAKYKQVNTKLESNSDTLHMAVEMPTTGYVAMAFATSTSSMINADAVIGWVNADGSSVVGAYPMTSHSVSLRSNYSGDAQFLSHASAVASNGVTTMCFSRPLSHPGAQFSANLNPSAPLKLIFAQGPRDVRNVVYHVKQSGAGLDLGSAKTVKPSRDWSPEIHGGLMAAAWALLAPLAILASRRRGALGGRQLGGMDTWFQLHRILVGAAVATFIAGLVVAFLELEANIGTIRKAHKYLAWALMASTGCQILLGVFRVGKTHHLRSSWELAHHSLGYITLAAGISNVFIGIQVYHDKTGYGMTPWIVACVVALGAVVVLDVLLWFKFKGGDQSKEQQGVVFAGPEGTVKQAAEEPRGNRQPQAYSRTAYQV